MLWLALQLSLAQLLPPAAAPPAQPWQPAAAQPPATQVPLAPAASPDAQDVTPDEGPPVPSELPSAVPTPVPRQRPPEPSRMGRAWAEAGAGVLGAAASLGAVEAMLAANNRLDGSFTNVGLGAIMVAGVAFTVHNALGGRGEVLFALLGSLTMMAGAFACAQAIDPTGRDVTWLTTAIGAAPAALGAMGMLELSSPSNPSVKIAMGPGSVVVRF